MEVISNSNSNLISNNNLDCSNAPYLEIAKQSLKNSFFTAIPTKSLLEAISTCVCYFIPNIFVGDEDHDYIEIKDQNSVDIATDYFLARKVCVEKDIEGRDDLVDTIKDVIIARLKVYLSIVNDFNKKLDTEIKFVVNVSDDEDISTQFASKGGQALDASYIYYNPPIIKATNSKEVLALNNALKKVQETGYSKDESEFILAHEAMHLLNNDCFNLPIFKVYSFAVSAAIWGVGLSVQQSWIMYLLGAYSLSLTTTTLTNFLYALCSRSFEKEADLGAIEFLKTNRGAVAFFERTIEKAKALNNTENLSYTNYLHPTTQERLDYCSAYIKEDLVN